MQPQSDSPPSLVRLCCRAATYVACTLVFTLVLPGCGNVVYTYRAHSATVRIEEARKAGAEQSATYEYTLAQEHLRKAMTEASEADYGDAYELAGLADDYAQRAVDKAKYRSDQAPPKTAVSNDSQNNGNASLSLSVGEQK